MKKLCTLIFCFLVLSLQAQDYYYNGSEKVVTNNSAYSFISFDSPTKLRPIETDFQEVETFPGSDFTILHGENSSFSTQRFQDNDLSQTVPALILNNDESFVLYPTRTVRVKLKPEYTISDITDKLNVRDILKTEERYGVISIEIKSIHEVIEIANKIYETGIAEYSIPDFYIPIELNTVDDPLFPLQYQMHNTGQVVDGIAGVNDMDCNALEAWDLSLGDNVTVAIIDEGVEAHEDIGNRLIGGFSPRIDGDGTPLLNNRTHGMNCAGIVGASDNDLGIRGVAPNVNFLSVNIFDGSTAGDIADGILWAVNNGADILSNSWHLPSACDFTNVDIENALQNAVDNGRNGAGAVIVFSAGNSGACVEYPARNPNVTSVGAIDNRGVLFAYSSRGPELDLVAPSGSKVGGLGVRTLDRMNDAGLTMDNYESNFGGTSAACPVVSGVAALVLSVNPALTQLEVRNILNQTATDMGPNGFDNDFGHGRVNALLAVEEALIGDISISGGTDIACSTNETITFNLDGLATSGLTVNWTTSWNLQIISSSNTSVTVSPTSTVGSAYVRASVMNRSVTHNIWLGIPSLSLTTDRPTTNSVRVNINGGGTDFLEEQKITNMTWQKISGNGSLTPAYSTNNIAYTAYGDHSISWSIYGRVTAYNQCGSSNKTFNIGWSAPNNGGGGGGRPPARLSLDEPTTNEMYVYPNPSNAEVNISFGDLFVDSEQVLVEVIDLSNRVVIQQRFSYDFGTVNVSALPNGIYILKASVNEDTRTERLIIK